MSDVLSQILEKKKASVAEQKKNFPLPDLERMLADAPAVRDFYAQVLGKGQGVIPVIAEIKRKSPSKGEIRPGLDPGELAKKYQAAGAAAVSVLCEEDHFGGSLEDLASARKNCSLPVLCKDFIISTFQVVLARVSGADVILLIVAALEQKKLDELFLLAKELQMTPLVEVHDQQELERALSLGARLIGINNRSLATLEVSLETTRNLLPLIPQDRIVISESGFETRAQLEQFQKLGVTGFLVGGALLAAKDPESKLREMVYGQG